mgnify:CR=1 FL=1
MIRRIPIRSGDAIACKLASALSIENEEAAIESSTLDICRDFAFSSENAEDFGLWYLRSECFSKFQTSNQAEDRKRVAIDKFHKAESLAEDANSRLVDPWTRPNLTQRVWRRARALVHDILGPFPWESFPWACGFGPGASGSLRRADASHQKKWVASTHITAKAIPYYAAFKAWSTLDLPHKLVVVEANRVTTVPKSYKTDRVIAIEPDWNMFFQLGVGGLIRQRLQRWGILLREAQEINRGLAKLGSWTNSLATLDMSMASDTVSLALCEALLPDDWLKVLLDLRSDYGILPDGDVVRYSKISSMGNGNTFELETLLFYVLTLAVCGNGNRARVSVYGDDIICPSEHADAVVDVLKQAGFTPNLTKSFSDGPFRESCGGHYWRGTDVTPFYLRQPPSCQNDLIVLNNSIVTWLAARESRDLGMFRDVYQYVRRMVPRSLRGPYRLDGVLWDEWDRCCPKWNARYQAYSQMVVSRELRYSDVSESTGSYFFKLWVQNTEAETSWLARPLTREVLQTRSVCRDQWKQLPVRIA